ncbi:sulfotransferase domain-containing protein [Roseicyclus marinus]|uniref:sulfotransferase domain-containing protein n=1 Tax=Roseicyclus marinus TaxID=2161673 RepID=UPI00240F5518|nr:sulfotransferase domain-containing protein [Roseicyclus marinus]MDG3042453.1 sulfotransferase domain-containing protein [Roseicyclus marinus]
MTVNEMMLDPQSINYDVFPPDFREVQNGKLVIFGIPKCGNTWVQSLLCKYFDVSPVLTVDEFNIGGVLSIHDPFESYMRERTDFVSGICLIRDIRDIIVSYFHYANTDQWRRSMTRSYYDDFDAFYYEWFLSRCVPAHRLHTFAEEFAARGVPIVRYERLNASPQHEFSRLLRRLGYDVDHKHLHYCVEQHQLSKLKKEGLDIRYRVETSHFRTGGWGNFLEEMPSHILADVNRRFSGYLERWGYPLDLSEAIVADYRHRLFKLSGLDE